MVTRVTVPELMAESERLVAELVALLPDWTADESDPLRYAIEQRVANKIIEYQELNASYRALIVSQSTGDDLDLLMANYNLTRNASESDAEFRARLPLQFAALSKDTDSYILVQALSYPGVSDASFIRRANYNVDVYIQATGYTDSNPPAGNPPVRPSTDSTLQAGLQTFMNSGTVGGISVSPWFSDFNVQNETRTDYTIDGTVTYQSPATEESIAAAITAQELVERRLGRTVQVSRFIAAALGVLGVNDAQLTLTPAPQAGTDDTVYVGSIGTVTYTEGTII